MAIGALPVWSFEPNWDGEVVETLKWLTDILTSPTGAEQRRSMRDMPRATYEFSVLVAENQRAFMANFINMHGGRQVYLPLWYDKYEVNATSSFKNVFMNVTDDFMIAPNDICIITNGDPFVFDLFEVDSVSTDRFRAVSNLSRSWPAGSYVYKVIEAQFDEQPQPSSQNSFVDSVRVRFRSMQPNDIRFIGEIPIRGVPPKGRPMVQPASKLVSATYQDTDDPAGTAKDQFIMAAAMLAAHEVLLAETTDEAIEACDYFKDLGLDLMDAIGDGDENTPILRAPIPADSETINLPHWLFVARGSETVHVASLDDTFTTSADGQYLTIPAGNFRGQSVEHIYGIYPPTAELFLRNPFSPAYDYENPTVDLMWEVPTWETNEDDGTTFVIPDTAEDLHLPSWNIVYRYPSTRMLELGQAYHLIPTIHAVQADVVHYTPDTLKFAERALTRAIALDSRAGMPAAWTALRSSWRKSDLKGRQIDDQRWIMRPMPLADPIPALTDWPKGFFSYSDNASARSPGVVESTDQAWTGYDFWTRDTNGDVIGTVPTDVAPTRVQYGRAFSDQWRQSQTFQDPDQYLYVAVSCSLKPTGSEFFLVWVSSADDDDDETHRWFADIGSLGSFVATTLVSGNVIEFLIPRTSFKKRTYDVDGNTTWGSTMPAGQILKSFGISAEIVNTYTIRLRAMRLLAGPSTGWVTSNLALAKKGYVMPFAPGVSPAFINANLEKQEFMGTNGSPLHGYQLADTWKLLETEANSKFAGLVPGSLPVPDRTTNVIGYPISATTTVGVVSKTPAALLIEQQLLFLKAAQEEWLADGASEGPFAHTYVMNTYDRLSFVDQAHSQWTYENFSYSGWGGYQYRVVESLTQLIDMVGANPIYSDVKTLAIGLLTKFMAWVAAAWPNLDGQLGSVDGVIIHSGDETSYHQFTGEEYPVIEGYIE